MDKIALWNAVLTRMNGKISRMEFHTWFKKVKLTQISGSAALISCPTEMNKNWLESKYKSVIQANINAILPEIDRVFFEVNLSLADEESSYTPEVFEKPKAARKLPNQPIARFESGHETRITQEKFTLQNFIVGEENKFAHAACEAVAHSDLNAPKNYSPRFIYGGVGLGKTHLLQGTANELKRRNPGAKIIYITAERLMNEIVKAIRERKTDVLRKKYRQVDALIIDDIQFFEGKDKSQEELFNTFNDLYEFNKQIMFSADRPPADLVGITDRLRSRMGWGLSADIHMPAFETRVAILQAKSKELQLFLPEEIQEFIATNIRSNLRELENVLNQISAEVDISGISPTVQSVGKIFRKLHPTENILARADGKGSLAKSADDVVTLVSDYFQIPATDLLGTSRKQEIVFPRQVSWLLCKDVLKMSYEAIGKAFGGKNHTTIMHGLRKIKALSRKDSSTARHLHALKKDLGVK